MAATAMTRCTVGRAAAMTTLNGGPGDDRLYGGVGDDTLDGSLRQ